MSHKEHDTSLLEKDEEEDDDEDDEEDDEEEDEDVVNLRYASHVPNDGKYAEFRESKVAKYRDYEEKPPLETNYKEVELMHPITTSTSESAYKTVTEATASPSASPAPDALGSFLFSASESPISKGVQATLIKEDMKSKLNETRWNEMYQLLLECWPVDRVEYWVFKHLAITQLLETFVSRAQEIATIIIDEIYLEDSKKTYIPITHSYGFAGGMKYKVDGIFIKLAVTRGGLFANDELAMKNASSELRYQVFFLHFIMCLEL
jgi:hypothetical protein